MSDFKVIQLEQFDASAISVGKVKDNRNGAGKSANISYDAGRFYLVLNKIRFPFGASKKPDEFKKGNKDQYTLQCELTEEQINKIKEIEEHLLDICVKNEEIIAASGAKKPSRDILESKFWSMLKYSKDKADKSKVNTAYPPTIRIAIPNDNEDGFNCNFYKSSNGTSEKVTINNVSESENHISNFLTNGSTGSVLATASLWFSSSGFGISLRASQIKAEPRRVVKTDVCLLDQFDSTPSQSTRVPTTSHVVEDPELEEEASGDADDEEIEEVDEEPTPEPTPEPPKKPAAKRTTAVKAK